MASVTSTTGINGRAFAAALGAALAAMGATGSAGAAHAAAPTNAQLQAEIKALKTEVAQLQAKPATGDQQWTRTQEAAQMKAIAEEVMAESQKPQASALQAGYNHGFFIQTPNKDFKLTINGYLQFRYSYAAAGNDTTPAGAAGEHKDYSGFNFRRARLILSGNAFKNFIYCISGDFETGISGAPAGSNNAFAILDTWAGYKFSPMFIVRAGSMLVPFTHVEYFSSGTEFPDFAVCEYPFDPVRSDALDLEGAIVPHTFNYEIQINNGSTSQDNGPVGPGGHFGNRMGVYGRVNFAQGGPISDFNDSPDVAWHRHLAWLIGAAAGYESQNSTLQTTTSFPSLGAWETGAGNYTLNGSLSRFTVDAHAKYRGFAFNSALYLQNISNDAPAPALAGYASVLETGYYVEGGYFVIPHRWELAARFGELMFNHSSEHQYEATGGVNYYIFGENAKIQAAVTYVNNAAYTNSNLGTTVGTDDLIGQIQLQFKF